MKNLKICCIQFDVNLCETHKNFEKVIGFLDKSASYNPDIVCLPELFNTGYCFERLSSLAEPIPGKTLQILSEKASCYGFFLIAGSIFERADDGFYNTAIVFDPEGSIISQYRKIHLFPLFGEGKYLKPGNKLVFFEAFGIKVGLMICYDIRFPELARSLTLSGINILFVPSQFPLSRIDHWKILLRARAIENQIFVCGVNRTGHDEVSEYGGHTTIIDPWGKILLEAGRKEGIFFTIIELERIKEAREALPSLEDRRPDLYFI
jgi:predicted amidohydrolase